MLNLPTLPLLLVLLHFTGDFLLQNDWMAINKSKRMDALFLHVLIYSLCFVMFGVPFWLVTFVSHILTDFVTSRISRRVFPWIPMRKFPRVYIDYEGKNYRSRHWFFVNLGFDQVIHFVTLAFTYRWLVSGV